MPDSDRIIIRQMTIEDIPAVAETERLTLGAEAWSESSLLETLSRNGHYFVAAVDGKTAGHGGFTVVLDEGDITNIAVRHEFRRQGLASKILEAMISEANKRHLSFLTLEVRKSNTPAVLLYEKYGFTVRGERKSFYRNPTENALIMTLDF